MEALEIRLQERLKGLHHRRFAIFFGSGTAALAASIKSQVNAGSRIGIPVNVCPSVVTAVYAAGMRPVYIDIEPSTQGMDPEKAREAKPDMIVAVHSYGVCCDIVALQEVAEHLSIPLIEDSAVAQGGALDSRPVGSFGRISILSFGAGKIIDAGGNGVALTDYPEIAATLEREASAYGSGNAFLADALSRLHTYCYNNFREGKLSDLSYIFRLAAASRPEVWLSRFDGAKAATIGDGLDGLAQNLERRKRKYGIYARIFDELGLRYLQCPPGSACWRFILFLPYGRDGVLKRMLADGDKVSSWYPPIAPYFEDGLSAEWPVAEEYGKMVLNLWVNDEVSEEDVRYYAHKVSQLWKGEHAHV